MERPVLLLAGGPTITGQMAVCAQNKGRIHKMYKFYVPNEVEQNPISIYWVLL
jgi:hypothetical protein